MTQDQYTKVGFAAHDAWEEDAKTNPRPVNPHAYVYGFKAAGRAILDNPSEWGLVCRIEASEHLRDTDSAWEDALVELKDQNKRYREALEKISLIDFGSRAWGVAVGALQDNRDREGSK